jgi:hypothetical protein
MCKKIREVKLTIPVQDVLDTFKLPSEYLGQHPVVEPNFNDQDPNNGEANRNTVKAGRIFQVQKILIDIDQLTVKDYLEARTHVICALQKSLDPEFKIKNSIIEFWKKLSFVKNGTLDLEEYLASKENERMINFKI